jgi:glutathione S-transferase
MRVHYNALEGLPLFLVLLFLAALWSPLTATAGGVLWIVGRAMYAMGYYQATDKRGPGAGVFHLGELVLLFGSVALALKVLRS